MKGRLKRHIFTLPLAVFLLLAVLLGTFPMFIPLSGATDDTSFSIIQIGDTQYLSAYYPSLFDEVTTWITDNEATYNLKMVIHTGDIVDNGTSMFQWANANASMSKLIEADVPYCWTLGNHDQIPGTAPNGASTASGYAAFNATAMRSKPYWVDDLYDSKNTAVKFACDSYNFLIINVEYVANASVINWMKGLLEKNKGANVIVATHSYLNNTLGYGFSSLNETTWANNFKAILDSYSNVFLTVCGHDPMGSGTNMTRVGSRVEVFFDRQRLSNKEGAAAARIFTFNLTSMQVDVTTYSAKTQTLLTDAYDKFSFSISLNPALTVAATPNHFSAQSGQTALFSVNAFGGAAPYIYQWYRGTNPLKEETENHLSIAAVEGSVSFEFPYYCRVTDADGKTVASNPVFLKFTPAETSPTPNEQKPSSITPSPTPSLFPESPAAIKKNGEILPPSITVFALAIAALILLAMSVWLAHAKRH